MSSDLVSPAFRLIVGLGNPGREYLETRHNVGFMVLDRMAAASGATFRVEKTWKSELAKVGDVYLCKPLTFMNLSGEAVRQLSHFYKTAPAQILVVVDDMALPLGKLRFRPSGSSGGHNGLKSIGDHLGTNAFPRLRIGIGDKPQPGAAVGHVLGRFAPAERELLNDTLILAMQAIAFAQDKGLQAAMNAYN